MSFQVQPQPQQQQPLDVYPNPVTKQPTSSSSSSHSGGSFGTVFIVLAVILVVSAIACCLGRFCSKRRNSSSGHQKSSKPNKHNKHNKPSKNSLKLHDGPPSFGPKDRVNDIELGFEKGFPTGGGGGGGGGRPAGPAGYHNGIGDGGSGRQNKIFGNGHIINAHAKVEPSHVSFQPQLRSGGR